MWAQNIWAQRPTITLVVPKRKSTYLNLAYLALVFGITKSKIPTLLTIMFRITSITMHHRITYGWAHMWAQNIWAQLEHQLRGITKVPI